MLSLLTGNRQEARGKGKILPIPIPVLSILALSKLIISQGEVKWFYIKITALIALVERVERVERRVESWLIECIYLNNSITQWLKRSIAKIIKY